MSVLQRLGARVAVRGALHEAVADARAAEDDAHARLDKAFAAFAAARDAYETTGEEPLRAPVRELAADLAAAHAPLVLAVEATRQAVADLQAADVAIATASRDLHDPELLARCAASRVLELLPPEFCDRCVSGEVEEREVRDVGAALAGYLGDCARARAAGIVDATPTHAGLHLVPLWEAYARAGYTPLRGDLFAADSLPDITKPHRFTEWAKHLADNAKPSPGAAANLAQRCATVRKLVVERGARGPHDVEALERALAGDALRVAAPPPAVPRRLENLDGTHYPPGIAPESTGVHAIARPTAPVHATAAAEPGTHGQPAIPAFLDPGVARHLR